MGNTLIGLNPTTILTGSERTHYHDNRLYNGKPSPYHSENLLKVRAFLTSWKTTKNEILFLSYRFVVGAFVGLLGGLAIHPLLRHSPYVYRKYIMSLPGSSIFPFENLQFLFRTVAPYYMTIGGFSGAIGTFLSEAYDRAFCTNQFTKYGILGAVDLTLLALIVGPVGSWTNAFLAGGIFGLAYCGIKTRSKMSSEGEFGDAAEYMSHISAEDIHRHKVQEARIMGVKYR